VPDESVSLQFVDLLYAVPVADLAVRVSATHLRHVTASGWTDLAVPLVALTFGWIGHHANRKKLPVALSDARESGRQFLTLRFCQFVVEILIMFRTSRSEHGPTCRPGPESGTRRRRGERPG
jgi:hypothetical protein